jgi:hypothetical protein
MEPNGRMIKGEEGESEGPATSWLSRYLISRLGSLLFIGWHHGFFLARKGESPLIKGNGCCRLSVKCGPNRRFVDASVASKARFFTTLYRFKWPFSNTKLSDQFKWIAISEFHGFCEIARNL